MQTPWETKRHEEEKYTWDSLNLAAPTFTNPEITHLIAPPTENEAADVAPMPEMQDVYEVESTTQPEAT